MPSSNILNNSTGPAATIDATALKIFWGHVAQSSVSLLVSMYVFVSFTVFEIRRKGCFARTNSKDRGLALASRILCMLASFMSTASAASSFVELLSRKSHYFELKALQNQTTCTAIFPAWYMLCGTTCVYLFLWMRQRVFYIDPMLSQIAGCGLQTLSFIVLTGWIGYFIYGSIILGTQVRLIYIPGMGCRLPMTAVPVAWQFFVTFVIACAIMQTALLFLFIYPLLKRHIAANTRIRSKSLHRRVAKAACLTSVCVFTDCVAYLTFYVFSSNKFPVYGLNLALNVFIIVLCFDYWKEILIPCVDGRQTKKFSRSGITSHSSGSTVCTTST